MNVASAASGVSSAATIGNDGLSDLVVYDAIEPTLAGYIYQRLARVT